MGKLALNPITGKLDLNGPSVEAATFALAIGTPATVGANKTNEVVVPRSGTIVKAFARAKTAPTGADLIFDINKNGVSIWATNQANRLKIVAGANGGTQMAFDTTSVSEGDVLSIDIDQVGSVVAGQDITVELLMRLNI